MLVAFPEVEISFAAVVAWIACFVFEGVLPLVLGLAELADRTVFGAEHVFDPLDVTVGKRCSVGTVASEEAAVPHEAVVAFDGDTVFLETTIPFADVGGAADEENVAE